MSEWIETTVGEIAASSRNALVGGPFGSNLVSKDYVDQGVPVIRGQNMGGRWVAGDFACVSTEKAAALSANTARPGDIVFTQRGTLGQVALVPDSPYETYVVSQSQMKLTVDPEKADSLFLYYLFSSPIQQEYIRQNSIQVGVPHTNLGILRDTPVVLPKSVDVQKDIARQLGTLDDKIELNRRMNETLEAMARAIFQSWFVDFDPVRAKASGESADSICQRLGLTPKLLALFPDSFEDSELGEIPSGWMIGSIGTLANVTGGSTPNTKEPKYWDDGVHCWATPKDLSRLSSPVLLETERKVSDDGLAQIGSGLLKPGAVLLSSRAPIGYRVINEVPVAVNQGFIAMTPNSGVSKYFLLYWAEWAHDEIVSRANGSTFLEISKANFRPIPVVRPTDALFEKFDQYVGPLYKRIVSNEQEKQLLVAQRDSLLPKLLSGEVMVAAEEEAS
ncbi:restriction modification system DNA specificity domain [Rhodoferax ferrireducens T118]|uniref:Restriction modification system DNA specificity domain n=1 Tax=Albidiferax ferrireducens (strain ATCC BAA-621 / DSM 15236 / T118) TaxID=338969 RepID=Q223G9_ALBFT|nr:restriction endonuclease subunit S [Rhodoferax ferrireducens]ABD67792.1 restriction modification system DNA specificity domain [Rhodoferax ferrireducens T118]